LEGTPVEKSSRVFPPLSSSAILQKGFKEFRRKKSGKGRRREKEEGVSKRRREKG